MFGQSKPVVIDRYASRRSRNPIPNWLWLLIFGALLGAGTVIYVQEKHLPPRLTTAESTKLQSAFDSTEQERERLAADLARTKADLQKALDEKNAATAALATSQTDSRLMRASVDALVALLPPDPRGTPIQVRAARFSVAGEQLGYNVVLSRAQAGTTAFNGEMQLLMSGKTSGGAEAVIPLGPVKVAIGSYEIASGTLTMPAGFVPREATIRVLDGPAGRLAGMRVMYVR